jgi:hypothetical protein
VAASDRDDRDAFGKKSTLANARNQTKRVLACPVVRWQGNERWGSWAGGSSALYRLRDDRSIVAVVVSFLIHPLGPLSPSPAFLLPSRSLLLNMSVSTLPTSNNGDRGSRGLVNCLFDDSPPHPCFKMQGLARRAQGADPFLLFPYHRPTRPVRDSSSEPLFKDSHLLSLQLVTTSSTSTRPSRPRFCEACTW